MTEVLEIDVDQVTERLRASKEQYEEEQERQGKAAGRRWAANEAEYSKLKALVDEAEASVTFDCAFDMAALMDSVIGADPRNEPESSIWYNADTGRVQYPDDAYAHGFLAGARGVWNEVSDRI